MDKSMDVIIENHEWEEISKKILSDGTEDEISEIYNSMHYQNPIDQSPKIDGTAHLIFFAPFSDFHEEVLREAFVNEGFDQILHISKLKCNLAELEVSGINRAIDIVASFLDKQTKANNQQVPVLTLSPNESIQFCEMVLADLTLKHTSSKSLKKDPDNNKTSRNHTIMNLQNNSITHPRPVELLIEEIPGGVDANDLLSVFSRCGRVEGIKTFTRSSEDARCCASLIYSNMSMAQKAIRCLDGKYKMNESSKPLSIRLVNT